MENRYGSLAAWVYHLDKPIGRSFGDIAFYTERLSGCDGPVLEPAVGNGRIFIPLLEAGIDMRGFDASPEMIAHCRKECALRGLPAPVDLQRFETFSYAERFAAVIVPAGSFQLVTDPETACAVLRRFHEALRPGGRLIVDLDPLSSLAAAPGAARQWRDGDDLLTLREDPVARSFSRQTVLSQLRYEHWRDGALVATELDLFHLRFWGLLEFRLALREAGFTDIVVCGDYRPGTPPEEDAATFTFEAVAAGSE
ncbi:class I SAM-dependent methyltransferase [Nitratireductor pacificus]|uniref:Type 12 methyltransferase n=1 Tax=Nitratireductor pacificus pht-3B TaxID=391937 RepID=K2MZ20_9HYPH|nr:class I SAM-dependent methyltransferase [Nitratireductor pacificus]EKF17228.1 type 12 methyltransferase [Nitratireductor pacificus pht-3B]